MVSTNMGLIQANMTWLNKSKGLSYHWLLELFHRLKLPLSDGMVEALEKGNELRAKNLKKSKQMKQNSSTLTGRKLVYKSKRKGSSGSVNKGFSILMVQTTTMMMMMMS